MSKVEIHKTLIPATRDFLRKNLKAKKIDAVFTLGKAGKGISYLLIADPDKMDEAMPFYPLMPENAGALLSKLTFSDKLPDKVAVAIRPCELHAFVELAKRAQGAPDNMIFISPVCDGVVKFDHYKNIDDDEFLLELPNVVEPHMIRPTCKICVNFMPMNSDITITSCEKKTAFYANTETGRELASEIGKLYEGDYDEAECIPELKKRQIERRKSFEKLGTMNYDIEGLIDKFGRCIGCHGCSHVCPICFCALCAFESKENELNPENFQDELEKRGGMRIPTDTVFFHLGRMSHMAFSCVSCGMCTDTCPADIPVSMLFARAGDAAQTLFEYVPGRSYDEEIPLSSFVEDELTEVED